MGNEPLLVVGGGGPKYIQQGLPGSSPSPRYWGNLGLRGRSSTDVRVPRVFSKGPLVPQLTIPPRQPKRREGRAERGEEGPGRRFKQLQLPDMCPHLCWVF